MTTLELLKSVRELLSDPDRWCSNGPSRTADGRLCLPCDPAAVKWSLGGAVQKLGDWIDIGPAMRVLVGTGTLLTPDREKALAALDTAISYHGPLKATPDTNDQEDKAQLVEEVLEDWGIEYKRDEVDTDIRFTTRRGNYAAEISVDENADVWLALDRGTIRPIRLPDEESVRAAATLMRVWTPEYQGGE